MVRAWGGKINVEGGGGVRGHGKIVNLKGVIREFMKFRVKFVKSYICSTQCSLVFSLESLTYIDFKPR